MSKPEASLNVDFPLYPSSRRTSRKGGGGYVPWASRSDLKSIPTNTYGEIGLVWLGRLAAQMSMKFFASTLT